MKPLIKIAELAKYFMRHKVLINKLDPVKHQAEIETIWASLKQNENESEYQQKMIASADTLVHPRAIDALINKRNNTAQNCIKEAQEKKQQDNKMALKELEQTYSQALEQEKKKNAELEKELEKEKKKNQDQKLEIDTLNAKL